MRGGDIGVAGIVAEGGLSSYRLKVFLAPSGEAG